jgi:hypothetical protein
MAQSKRLGKGKVIQVLDSVRQPSTPPVATLTASDADLVSSWSMPEDYQEGQGFRTSIIAEASPAGWITIPRNGKKVSFTVAVQNPTPPQPQTTPSSWSPTLPNPALDLTKANLEKLSKDEVRRLLNIRFNANVHPKTHSSKDALIPYLPHGAFFKPTAVGEVQQDMNIARHEHEFFNQLPHCDTGT